MRQSIAPFVELGVCHALALMPHNDPGSHINLVILFAGSWAVGWEDERWAIAVGRYNLGEVLRDRIFEQRRLQSVNVDDTASSAGSVPRGALWHEPVSRGFCVRMKVGRGTDAEAISVEEIAMSSSLRLIGMVHSIPESISRHGPQQEREMRDLGLGNEAT